MVQKSKQSMIQRQASPLKTVKIDPRAVKKTIGAIRQSLRDDIARSEPKTTSTTAPSATHVYR